ncbi:DUF4279 domain-containing protein [uncultured Methylobacterium sp.]|jgi:hypothetical protein|uniref:DUF4279 domain-containing protein n=1 Tax=uncultured Methylobacterium sp. TaxID=157278 RepID=UPI00260F26E1|nr:DUF4279 domain-containing protein [uncultured Methylobacterium sp.]
MMKTEPSTIKTFATLRFASPALDPDILTDILRVEPTHAYRNGESRPWRNGTLKTADIGLWLIATDKFVHSPALKRHVDYIDHLLTKHHKDYLHDPGFKRILHFVGDYQATPTVTLFWHGRHGAAAPKVGTRLPEIVARLNGTLHEDFATDEAEAVAS